MTPPPRKPTPETTYAAICVTPGIPLPVSTPSVTNRHAPLATSVIVRKPAVRWRICRSRPMATPQANAVKRRSANSKVMGVLPCRMRRAMGAAARACRARVHYILACHFSARIDAIV
ncbi:hypothetical protein X948_5495 [Burkholderia pseudomallei MSHR5608]|nr:hypothetical protein X948_5495 [Burkholderia pseudomallei MSHR5608]